MSCEIAPYFEDQLLPALGLRWFEQAGGVNALIDFSSGWTFSARFIDAEGAIARIKTSGIQGGDGGIMGTDPNIVVSWLSGDFNGLAETGPRRSYRLRVRAIRNSDGFPRDFMGKHPPTITIMTPL